MSYSFGRIEIDGHTETRDVIILPGRVLTNWWRKDGHSLVLEDLSEVLDELPRHLIVGSGADSRMRPESRTLAALHERGIEVEVLPTPEAVARYGASDEANTAMALHLTC